jgi:superfamily I DNA/RNA helicase
MGQAIQLQVDAEAWLAEPGPILLLAGPGTGKTHQLALRVKHLVESKKVSPQAIHTAIFQAQFLLA